MDEKNLKIARYLTGALFLALALVSLTVSFPYYTTSDKVGYVVSALGAVIMAVSMFLGMRQIFIVGTGFRAVSCLIRLLASQEFSSRKNIVSIFSLVLLLLGYVFIALAIQDKKNASKYEIVSVALFLIGCVLEQIAFVKEAASIIWALQNFVRVASPILLACIVFENIPQAQTTKMVKQPTKTAKSNDRIEELTKLKDLLDTGVITQEEFDAKKKQLLNL